MSDPVLTFEAFCEMNRRRCESVHGFNESLQPDSEYTLAHWVLSVCSEAGEAADAVTGYDGVKERRAGKTREDIAAELADVITYADLAIQKLGLWTPDVLARKFHAVNARLEEKDPHCGAVKRFALSPEAPKPALTEAEIEAARKRAAERIEKFGWAPKPAEAATCPSWCGKETDGNPIVGNWNVHTRGLVRYCSSGCWVEERPLHPATEQAATPVAAAKPRRTCNRHDDCDEADTRNGGRASHCHDETCEDCLGS